MSAHSAMLTSEEIASPKGRNSQRELFFADVFVPDGGVGANIICQKVETFGGIEVNDFDSKGTEPVQAALEIAAFSDNYLAKTELADKAAAIPTWSKRRDHNKAAIAALAAGVAEGVRFTVHGGIAILHAAIVAGTNEFSLAVENCGADGDTALGQALAGF